MSNRKHKTPFFDLQFFTSTVSISLVLVLLGSVVLLVLGAGNLSSFVRENFGVTVVLEKDAKSSDINTLKRQLSAKPYAKSIKYISKEDVLNDLKETLGADPEDFVGYNPFPASIEVSLRANYANLDSLKKIGDELMKNTLVEEVSYPKDLISSVNRNIRTIGISLLTMAAVLAFISFALISNTIRLTIYSKRFLIHTMTLVGASWGFIRRPFLWRNFWIGVISAIFANLIIFGGLYYFLGYEPDILEIITPMIALETAGAVFGFGIFISLFSAYISINKYLKMKGTSLHYV